LLGADIEAKLRSAAGDHRGAILALSAYVELQPAAPDFYRGMAWQALHLGDVPNAVACLEKARELAPAAQAEFGDYLSRNDPGWARQPALTQLLAVEIAAFADAYDFAQELHFWVQDEARALREYDLILAQYEPALACWRRAAAARAEASPISTTERQNFDRKLGIVAYNKGCILAKGGRADDALAALRQAFQHDATLRDEARTDADLAALRENPNFIELTRSPDAQISCAEASLAPSLCEMRML